jgi:hypothetical protein
VDATLNDKPDEAFSRIGRGLTTAQPDLFLVSERNTSVMAGQALYRLVRNYPNFDLNRRASVFHIPFESRHRYFGTWYCNLEYELDRRETDRVETDPGRGSAVVG